MCSSPPTQVMITSTPGTCPPAASKVTTWIKASFNEGSQTCWLSFKTYGAPGVAVAVRVGFGAKVAVGARGLEVKIPGLGETLGEGVVAEAAVAVGGVVAVEAGVSDGQREAGCGGRRGERDGPGGHARGDASPRRQGLPTRRVQSDRQQTQGAQLLRRVPFSQGALSLLSQGAEGVRIPEKLQTGACPDHISVREVGSRDQRPIAVFEIRPEQGR